MSSEDRTFTVGEASQKIDLPESTIRYYDREFSDYLSIERGKNNQRLITEENLKDLEYIRYLLKRENLTVSEVKEKFDNEAEIREEKEAVDSSSEPAVEPEPETAVPEAMLEETREQIAGLNSRLESIEKQLSELREEQETLHELLDMNLERYNQLVDKFT